MPKYVHLKGMRFSVNDTVRPPKKRFGLPCYSKDICQVEHCKFVDTVVGYTITRQPCDKDCERRIVNGYVSIAVCIKAKCDFLTEGCYCEKFVEENKVKHKPTVMQFPTGLRTPSGEVRGWYGHKKLDGSGGFA